MYNTFINHFKYNIYNYSSVPCAYDTLDAKSINIVKNTDIKYNGNKCTLYDFKLYCAMGRIYKKKYTQSIKNRIGLDDIKKIYLELYLEDDKIIDISELLKDYVLDIESSTINNVSKDPSLDSIDNGIIKIFTLHIQYIIENNISWIDKNNIEKQARKELVYNNYSIIKNKFNYLSKTGNFMRKKFNNVTNYMKKKYNNIKTKLLSSKEYIKEVGLKYLKDIKNNFCDEYQLKKYCLIANILQTEYNIDIPNKIPVEYWESKMSDIDSINSMVNKVKDYSLNINKLQIDYKNEAYDTSDDYIMKNIFIDFIDHIMVQNQDSINITKIKQQADDMLNEYNDKIEENSDKLDDTMSEENNKSKNFNYENNIYQNEQMKELNKKLYITKQFNPTKKDEKIEKLGYNLSNNDNDTSVINNEYQDDLQLNTDQNQQSRFKLIKLLIALLILLSSIVLYKLIIVYNNKGNK